MERRQDNPCNASDASARLVERASRSCSDGHARPGSLIRIGLSRTLSSGLETSRLG